MRKFIQRLYFRAVGFCYLNSNNNKSPLVSDNILYKDKHTGFFIYLINSN